MLYKYVTFNRARVLLTTQHIRLTQPSDFNDPFELHPEFQMMSQEDIAALPPAIDENGEVVKGMRQLTPEAMQRMLSAVLPHIARMQSVYQQFPETSFAIDNNAVGRDYYDRNFGILSLTETPDNLLMWAHYADSHRGMVVGFEESHAFFQGPDIVPGLPRLNKVEYNLKRPVLSLSTREHPKVFLRKSTEWAYEKEWRLIRPLKEASMTTERDGSVPLCLFGVPKDAIKMVITGALMAGSEHHELRDILSADSMLSHVKAHHALLSKEHYKLDIHPALTEEERQKRLGWKVMSAKPLDI